MNLPKTKFRTLALTVCIGLVATGCGSQQTKPVSAMTAAEKAQLAQAKDTVNSVVDGAIQAFNAAESNDVARYSQIYFPDAKKDLAKLKEMHKEFNPNKSGIFDSGYSLEQIKEQASSLTQNVKKSEKTKQLITTDLKEVIDNQNYIETLDLSKFESKYKSLQSDVKRLFKDLERAGQFQGMEGDRLQVLNDLRAFEVSVIKEKYYNHPQNELEGLPESTLPVTYSEAQKRLNTLSKTIESTPRAMETIELREKEALKALTRAKNTLKEINWIDENTSKGLEHIVLRYHKPMDRAFPDVLKEDHSELIFEDQVSKYSYLVTNLKGSLQKELSSMDEATIKAEAQKIADKQTADLKKELEGQHGQQLQKTSQQQEQAIAKAKQEEQARFDLEKKQIAEQNKLKVDALIAERDKLALDYEQASLELSKLKEQQQLAAEQKRLKDEQDKLAASKAKEAPQKPEPKQVAKAESAPKAVQAQSTSTAKKNSTAVATAPVVTAPKQPVSVSTPVEAADDSGFGFDFEIEDVDL